MTVNKNRVPDIARRGFDEGTDAVSVADNRLLPKRNRHPHLLPLGVASPVPALGSQIDGLLNGEFVVLNTAPWYDSAKG